VTSFFQNVVPVVDGVPAELETLVHNWGYSYYRHFCGMMYCMIQNSELGSILDSSSKHRPSVAGMGSNSLVISYLF
jgi:hypothetical protein